MDANAKLEALKEFRSQMEGKNHFEILGIDQSADDAAVRSAYFGLLKLYGADYFHHVVDTEGKAAVEDVNKRLRQAYDVLGKSSKRDAYIASLNAGTSDEDDSKIDIGSVFEAEQALSQARSLMERGDFNVAIQKLEKALKLDPKSLEIKVRLSYAQYMVMEVDARGQRKAFVVNDIIECLEGACENLPNADYLRVYLGDIENLEGHTEKSLAWYKKALAINSDNLQAKRAINLHEERERKEQEKAQQEEQKNSSFFDKVKAFIQKLDSIKLG